MTMLSFLIENQALEWQDLSEEDGISFQFCGPKRQYFSHLKLLDSTRDGIESTEYVKQRQNSKGNVFDRSKTTFFKKCILQMKEYHLKPEWSMS